MGGFYPFPQAKIICAHLRVCGNLKSPRISQIYAEKRHKKVGTNNFRPYFQFSIFTFQFLPTGRRSR